MRVWSTVVVWAASGPLSHYSDAWQLVINRSATIVKFLMVFLIQSAQNRDGGPIHLNLDEIIRGAKGPRNLMVDLEYCSEEELIALETEFRKRRLRNTVKEELKRAPK